MTTAGREQTRVFDLRGRTIFHGQPPAKLKLPPGHYFVETKGDRTQFAVLPDDYAEAAFFGLENDDWLLLIPRVAQLAQLTQPGWTRIRASYWHQVQPKRGQWRWQTLDASVSANQHRKIILMAFPRPDWVRDEEFLARFVEYVRALAQRYKGKIYAIEIWNEPHPTQTSRAARFPQGDTDQKFIDRYIEMLRACRQVVDRLDPKVRLVGPAWSHPFYTSLNELLAAQGGRKLLDAISWHDYSLDRFAPDEDYHKVSPELPRLDKRLAQYRRWYGNMPFLVTEFGLFGNSPLGIRSTEWGSNTTWYRGMCRTIKAVVMHRAAGVHAIFPHVFFGTSAYPKQIELEGWDQMPPDSVMPRGPHPRTSAFLLTCYWLEKATLVSHRILDDKVFLYEWRRPSGQIVVIAWCVEGHSVGLVPPKGFRMTDIYGQAMNAGVIGEEPVLFQTQRPNLSGSELDTIIAALQR